MEGSHLLTASQLSVGNKSLLFIRLAFTDIPEEPVSRAKAAQVMQTVGPGSERGFFIIPPLVGVALRQESAF